MQRVQDFLRRMQNSLERRLCKRDVDGKSLNFHAFVLIFALREYLYGKRSFICELTELEIHLNLSILWL